MSRSSRPVGKRSLTRWLPHLERLETREVPVASLTPGPVNWQELGPNVIADGQTRNITGTSPNGGVVNDPVIGAVSALAAHPTNPDVMFAAGVNGGVWRTNNATAATPTWKPLSDNLATLSVSDLYLDPDNPNRLAVGIGGVADGEEVEGTEVRGDLVGLYFTENALAGTINDSVVPTWTNLNSNLAGREITNVILRSPVGSTPASILVGTTTGLYRSTNGGATFDNTYLTSLNSGVTFNTNAFADAVFDIAENPRLRTQLYLATRSGGGSANPEIWRSDNGGASWGRVTDQPQQQLQPFVAATGAGTVNVQISVRDAGPLDNQVYVAVSNNLPTNAAEQTTPGLAPFQYAFSGRNGSLVSVTWSTNQGGNWTRMDGPRDITDDRGIGGVTNDTTTGVITVSTTVPHRLKPGDKVRIGDGITQLLTIGMPNTYGPNIDGFHIVESVIGSYPTSTAFTLTIRVTGGTGIFTVPPSDTPPPPGFFRWERVVGANPGENGEFLQLLASRTDQNRVYLGGDMSQFAFYNENEGGPVTFTGSYWEGVRNADPQDGNQIDSEQWDRLTDDGTNSGANPRTAPGADARDMVFSANGTLWVATGSGIFRRTNLTGSGGWNSASGNLRVGQFWAAAFDDFTNSAVGAMQDTGQVEQLGSGSFTWGSLLDNDERNDLLDQESAYTTFVDNFVPGRSVRYTLGRSFFDITRTVIDSTGRASNQLFFGSPTSPNSQFAGITDGRDLDPLTNAAIVLTLNNNQSFRGIYGRFGVYEDSDPQGVTGRIVNDITPAGMNGYLRSAAYGGKRDGIQFNQVLYLGTSTGQVFVRGEFDIARVSRPIPGTGTEPVLDIQMNPDDWRNAYVLKGNRVYETTDGGLNWTDITANLFATVSPTTGLPVGGLTTEVRTLALYDPQPGTLNGGLVALTGGRGGVFRRTIGPNSNGQWSEYGTGLPNTVVADLTLSGRNVNPAGAVDNRLLAGTFGRGAWIIPDVTPTLTQPVFLDVVGTAGADHVVISQDPSDANAVFITENFGTPQRFVIGQFNALRVNTGAGADTVIVNSAGLAGAGTNRFVTFPAEIHLGGDAGDNLTFNATAETANVTAVLTSNTLTGTSLFGGGGSVFYTGLQQGTLTLNTGSGADQLVLDDTTLPRVVFLNGGTGNDTYQFRADTTGNVGVSDSGGTDLLTVFGTGNAENYVSSGTSVQVNTLNVQFDNTVDVAEVQGQGGADTLAWSATALADVVELRQNFARPGSSDLFDLNGLRPTFRFDGMTQVAVNMGSGADGLYIDNNSTSTLGGSVNFVTFYLQANLGGDAGDQLLVNDSSETGATSALVTGTSIGANPGDNLFGTGGVLAYSGLAQGTLYLLGGGGADNWLVVGGSPLPALTLLNPGAGNDATLVDAAAVGQLLLNDVSGADSLTVNVPANQGAGVSAASLRLESGGLGVQFDADLEDLLVSGLGGGSFLSWNGTAAADSVFLMQSAAESQVLSGTLITRFRNMRQVTVNTLGGADLLQIDSNGAAGGGTVAFVTYVVSANMGGDAGDAVVVNDAAETADTTVLVNGTSVGAGAGDNLFGGGAYLVYTGLNAGTLQLLTGGGVDGHRFFPGTLPQTTQLFSGGGNDTFQFDSAVSGTVVLSDLGGSDTAFVNGSAGGDAFAVNNTTAAVNNLRVQGNSGVDSFLLNGFGGFDTLAATASAGSEGLTVRQTAAFSGVLSGFPLPARFDGLEYVAADGGGGTDTLTWEDGTATAYGVPSNPTAGLKYRPTGPTGGELVVANGTATTLRLNNITGAFTVNGDAAGQGGKDVLAVLGTTSLDSPATDGENVADNGRDVIAVTDAGLAITNASLGALKGVNFGSSPDGSSSLRMVYVAGGNEGLNGDTISASTTSRFNLVVNGGDPNFSPGDTLNLTTTNIATSVFTTNPTLGPPHFRVTDRVNGNSAGHLNFESVNVSFTNASGNTQNSLAPPAAVIFAAGSDAGGTGAVRVYNSDGTPRFGTIVPFGAFTGGVNVATGDVTGDGFPDVVAAVASAGVPRVVVYNGATGARVSEFLAYDAAFTGGVNVAVGYVNGDQYADIITGAGAGGGPNVKVFSGQAVNAGSTAPAVLNSFFAYDGGYAGGVRVAAGDLDGDFDADIITGTQSGTDNVRAFRTGDNAVIADFNALAGFAGGVNVSAGDITGDGRADFIVGAGPGGSTRVVIYGSDGSGLIRDFQVNDPSIPGASPIPVTSGVRVSGSDLDGDGLADVLVARGKGSRPFAQYLKVSQRVAGGGVAATFSSQLVVNVFGDTYANGVFVGG